MSTAVSLKKTNLTGWASNFGFSQYGSTAHRIFAVRTWWPPHRRKWYQSSLLHVCTLESIQFIARGWSLSGLRFPFLGPTFILLCTLFSS